MYGALTLCPYPRQTYKLKCINVHIPYPSPYVWCITIICTSTFKQSLVYFFPFLLSSCTFLYNYNFPFPHTQYISLYVPLMYNVKCPYIHQNLNIIFVLLHSQKSKTCVHKSICTVLHNTIIIIQNTSTTPFSMFMHLSKLTQKFCTSAFTEIQNLCA